MSYFRIKAKPDPSYHDLLYIDKFYYRDNKNYDWEYVQKIEDAQIFSDNKVFDFLVDWHTRNSCKVNIIFVKPLDLLVTELTEL